METKHSILAKLKFKTLSEQLTDIEFDKLLSKYRRQIGRERMLNLIGFGSSDSQLSALEGEILYIMQQRKPKKKVNDPPTSNAPNTQNITFFPTTMMGEIASYLDPKAYARFAVTNRKIFVNCNSPNRLVALNLDSVEDFTFISLRSYRHLESLDFALVNVDDFDYRLISGCHRLQTLMINGAYKCPPEYLNRFITEIDGVLSGVNTLALYGFHEDDENPLSPILLAQLLTLFPALTHLKLFNIDFTEKVKSVLLADCCPSLNRLSLHRVRQQGTILSAYGAKISTLTLSPSVGDFTPPNQDYSKIRRLCLYAPSQNTMNGFLKTTKNLEEICFVPLKRKGKRDLQPMTDSEIKRMTKELIVNFKSMHFIHISTRGHFENICDSIQKGLFCTKNRGKKFMEIGLTVDCREITDFNDFMCSISRIIVAMAQSETEKWILSLEANQHRSFEMDQDSMEEAVSAFVNSYKTLDIKVLFAGEWKYVFGSNSCCYMNAHRDWWNDCWKIDFY